MRSGRAKKSRDVVPLRNRFLGVAASAIGVTFLVQVMAFLRQLLIAGYFGVGRHYDGYVMVYTVATFLVFTFAGIFDSIAVPHLVRTREQGSHGEAIALARAIFHLSVLLGIGLSVLFVIAVPVLSPILATGFSPQERNSLGPLAWYFLPWTLLCVPYYAAAARHKMEWHFNRVFAAEMIVILVSIGALTVWHADVTALPFAYACGYGAGLIQLGIGAGFWRRKGPPSETPPLRSVVRNIVELFFANQTAGLAALVDRHMQSFLAAGGVGAVNYSTQITASLSTALTFREVYTVPLTYQSDRALRVERLLCGLILLSVPFAGAVSCFSTDIVRILLEHGQFDSAATAMTASALSIVAFTLITSSILAPMVRVLQIVDRIHYMHITYAAWAVSLAIFGYLFVLTLGWGVTGIAVMQLVGSIVATVVACCMVRVSGLRLRWISIIGWLVVAGGGTFVAYLAGRAAMFYVMATSASEVPGVGGIRLSKTWFNLSWLSTISLHEIWLPLFAGIAAYGAVIIVFYFVIRGKLRGVLFGTSNIQRDSRELA